MFRSFPLPWQPLVPMTHQWRDAKDWLPAGLLNHTLPFTQAHRHTHTFPSPLVSSWNKNTAVVLCSVIITDFSQHTRREQHVCCSHANRYAVSDWDTTTAITRIIMKFFTENSLSGLNPVDFDALICFLFLRLLDWNWIFLVYYLCSCKYWHETLSTQSFSIFWLLF